MAKGSDAYLCNVPKEDLKDQNKTKKLVALTLDLCPVNTLSLFHRRLYLRVERIRSRISIH